MMRMIRYTSRKLEATLKLELRKKKKACAEVAGQHRDGLGFDQDHNRTLPHNKPLLRLLSVQFPHGYSPVFCCNDTTYKLPPPRFDTSFLYFNSHVTRGHLTRANKSISYPLKENQRLTAKLQKKKIRSPWDPSTCSQPSLCSLLTPLAEPWSVAGSTLEQSQSSCWLSSLPQVNQHHYQSWTMAKWNLGLLQQSSNSNPNPNP